MKNNQLIQKFLTLVMLFIFTFSITPKKYLHDLIADHTDFYAYYAGDEPSLNQAGSNCHCEDLVVSTPFIQTFFQLDLPSELHYKELIQISYHFFFSITASTKDLRGPPGII